MRLYLLRHCAPEYKEGDVYFHCGLSETGLIQGQRINEFFKSKKIDLVLCSPFKRTRETLKLMRTSLRDTKIIFEESIIEMKKGIYEKKPHKELEEAYKKSNYSINFKPDGGENFEDLFERCKHVLENLKTLKEKKILLITHEGFITVFVYLVLGLETYERKFVKFKPGSITTLEFNNKFEIKNWNLSNVDHLFVKK